MKTTTQDGGMIELKMVQNDEYGECQEYWVEYRTRTADERKMTGEFKELPKSRTDDCNDCANTMYKMMIKGIKTSKSL